MHLLGSMQSSVGMLNVKKAFDFLKDQLSSIPMLAYPDTTKPYVLYTDASDLCICACLTQPCNENAEEILGLKNEKQSFTYPTD